MEESEQKVIPVLWNRNFILLLGVTFFAGTAITIQMGTLPFYVKQLGGSNATSGLIVGILGISGLLFRLPTGLLLDKYGRKGLLIVGLFILAADFLALNMWQGLLLLFLLRFIQGIGNGVQTTSAGTMFSDTIPTEKLSVGLGYYSIAQALPGAVGPMIGLTLMENYGFSAMFLVSFLFVLIAFGLSFFVKDYYVAKVQTKEKASLAKIKEICHVKVVVPSLLVFAVTLANSGVIAFLAQYANEKNLSGAGYYFVVTTVVTILFRLVFSTVFLQRKTWHLIIGSIFMIALSFFIIAQAQSSVALMIAGACYGSGYACFLPLLNTIVMKSVKQSQRGSATAIFSGAIDVAYGSGAILWGCVASILGFYQMYLFCGLLVIFAGILYWQYRSKLD